MSCSIQNNLRKALESDKVSVPTWGRHKCWSDDYADTTKCSKCRWPASCVYTSTSAKVNRKTTREMREAHQRVIARNKWNTLRKSLPKKDRSTAIRQAREQKFWERDSLIQEQGFAKVGTVAAAFAAGGLISVARAAVGAIRKTHKKADSMLDNVISQFTAIAESAKKVLGVLYTIPIAIVGLWVFERTESLLLRGVILAAMAATLGPKMWEQIGGFFSNAVPQSCTDDLSTMVATIMSFTFLPSGASKLLPEILRRISYVPRAAGGFTEIFKAGMNLIEHVFNAITSCFGKKAIHFGDAVTKGVKQWCAEAEELEMCFIDTKDGLPSIEFIEKVFRKIQDGYHLKHTLSDDRVKLLLGKAIDRLEARLKPFESQLQAAKTFRVEPEFLLLYGASKQGKTTMLVRAATSVLLMAKLVEAKHVLSNLWQKGDSKYFESYCGQKCMIMDDVFQEKVIPGMEGNEFMQVIRMVGNWSYPLNMASVDLKAKFFFNSPVIIGTTNLPGIDATTAPQVIACKEAVSRRVHRCLKISAAPDYTLDGGLDYLKMERELQRRTDALYEAFERGERITSSDVLSTFPWEAWTAERWDWNTGTSLGETVDLQEYLTQMAKTVREKLDCHNASLANLDKFTRMLDSVVDVALETQAGEIETFAALDGVEPPTVHIDTSVTNIDAVAQVVRDNLPSLTHDEQEVEEKLRALLDGDLPFSVANRLYDEIVALHDAKMAYATLNGASFEEVRGVVRDTAHRLHTSKYYMQGHYGWRVRSQASVTERLWHYLKMAISDSIQALDAVADQAQRMHDAAREWGSGNWLKDTIADLGLCLMQGAVILSALVIVRQIVRVATSVLLGVCGMVKGLFCSLFGIKAEDAAVDTQSNIKETTRPTKKGADKFVTSIEEQGFDGSQFEQKTNRVYGNTYKMILRRDANTIEAIGQILFIQGHLAALPQHYIDMLECVDRGLKLHFVSVAPAGSSVDTTVGQFLDQPLLKIAGQDLAFVNFGREWFSPARKITKYFLTAEQLDAATRDAHMVRLDVCQVLADGDKLVSTRHVMSAPRASVVPERTIGKHVRKNLLVYNMPTEKGMCGAPLTLADPKFFNGRPLLGLHIAGELSWNRRGYAVPITTELIGSVLKYFNITGVDKFEEDLESRGVNMREATAEEQAGLSEVGLVQGSFELVGVIDKGVNLAPYSKLKKSIIGENQPFGDMKQRPAVLGPVRTEEGVKYPMVEGLRNYQSPMEIRDTRWLSQVVGVASLKFRELTAFEQRRIFSFEEAVRGVHGLKIKAINRTTSAGFPYVWNLTKGKTAFFGSEGEYDVTSPECVALRERVNYILSEASQGNRLSHICVDFLKDELRPNEKVDACMTRIISGSPIDYVIAVRMMFGAFIAASFRHHTRSGMCPGINPYQDWWELAEHLKGGDSERTKFFDGDFKRFDASEQPYIHWLILDLINKWYDDGEENARIRTVLWMDLVHSRHICGVDGHNKYVVQWLKSLPSGHPLTTLVNSWYSLICLFACFHRLTHRLVDFRSAWHYISPATFGDDNITGVSDAVADVFNQVTVAETMFDLFGLTYTSGVKNEDLRPFKSLEECTFLKRRFVRDEHEKANGWVAPLEYGSFLFTSYYYKNNRDCREELAKKLDASLGELCLHSQSAWDQYAPMIVREMRVTLGSEPTYLDREGYRTETFSREDVWF